MTNQWGYKKRSAYFWMALGIVAMALLWQWLAKLHGPLVVPLPGLTLAALAGIFGSTEYLVDMYHTFFRCLIALVLLSITGTLVGMAAGFKPWLEQLIKPVNDLLIAIPAVALTLLVLFLFGGGSVQTVTIAVALGFPLLYGAAVTAVRSVDRDLLEMQQVYKVSKAVQWRESYLPAVLSAVLPNLLLAAGLIVRLMVMAEIIVGMQTGIGNALSMARAYLAVEKIFAWLLIMAVAVLVIEGGLLHLAKKHLLKWQAGR